MGLFSNIIDSTENVINNITDTIGDIRINSQNTGNSTQIWDSISNSTVASTGWTSNTGFFDGMGGMMNSFGGGTSTYDANTHTIGGSGTGINPLLVVGVLALILIFSKK